MQPKITPSFLLLRSSAVSLLFSKVLGNFPVNAAIANVPPNAKPNTRATIALQSFRNIVEAQIMGNEATARNAAPILAIIDIG